MPLSEILLITFFLLFLAMVVASVCRYIGIPHTVLLVILGLALNLSEPYFPGDFSMSYFQLTHELVLFVFLPALIFESALSLDARGLLKNLIPILVLAIPGMVVSMALVGLGLWLSLDINLVIAFLFGALISATDPVAVVALFKELGVPRRLLILVEGESLLNDATAIVLFNILLSFVLLNTFSLDAVYTIVAEFFRVFLGGVLVGSVMGLLMSELMVRFYHGNDSIPIILSMTLAYFSFIVAEHGFHVSGVMSVLTAAICLNFAGLMRLSNDTSRAVNNTWDVFVLICNSLLFILIGLSVDIFTLLEFWQSILFAVVAVTLARAVSVYLLVPLTTRNFGLPSVSYGERHIMWWGGLKGGLAIAIVLSIPDSLAEKQLLTELTLGVVLVSLLINATTIRYLIRWLKIDRLSNSEWIEFQQNMEKVKRSVDDILHGFAEMQLLDAEMQNSVEGVFENEIKHVRLEVTKEQRLQQIHLNALYAEMSELEFLHEIGMINDYTFVSFKDVLRKDGETSVNFDSEESNKNLANFRRIKASKKNILVQLELLIIRFLSIRNWAQSILVRYQETRFSNRIQHDIAGILMAHEGLKVIKKDELLLGSDKLKGIKEIYQNRLRRRQLRLNSFKEMYPEFYDQFEYFLFQQVALMYSLRLINEEYELNKITAKTYHQLQDCLQTALKQLPKVKRVLKLKKPDDWISKVPLFSGLPVEQLQQLSKNAQYVNFLSGDTIFNENDKGYSLYIVVSGRLNIFKLNAEGVSEHVSELREGSFVGEHALLKNARRSATVRAKTYVTLLRLTANEVIELSKILPELQLRLEAAELSNVTGNK
ncbi:MAG: cation:proton antiporter [Methylococcaceae bacterium]|nr:cation:proton antiporter [Methylococcaceae bacterium]